MEEIICPKCKTLVVPIHFTSKWITGWECPVCKKTLSSEDTAEGLAAVMDARGRMKRTHSSIMEEKERLEPDIDPASWEPRGLI